MQWEELLKQAQRGRGRRGRCNPPLCSQGGVASRPPRGQRCAIISTATSNQPLKTFPEPSFVFRPSASFCRLPVSCLPLFTHSPPDELAVSHIFQLPWSCSWWRRCQWWWWHSYEITKRTDGWMICNCWWHSLLKENSSENDSNDYIGPSTGNCIDLYDLLLQWKCFICNNLYDYLT